MGVKTKLPRANRSNGRPQFHGAADRSKAAETPASGGEQDVRSWRTEEVPVSAPVTTEPGKPKTKFQQNGNVTVKPDI